MYIICLDIKKKAAIFEPEDIDLFINSSNNDPYWLVRKVIVILSYFGGNKFNIILLGKPQKSYFLVFFKLSGHICFEIFLRASKKVFF